MVGRRAFTAGAALALCGFLPAIPTLADGPLKLEAGKPVTLTCDTQSIVVKDNGPAPTRGAVTLRLDLKAPPPNATGAWTPIAADDAHRGAFAAVHKTTCAAGCAMTVAANGDLQLWAPAPKSLDKLGPDEALLLAVIKADGLTLKASSFRGQAIEALENGTCKIAP